MRVITFKKLREFYEQPGHEDSKIALNAWRLHVKQAHWKSLADVKASYPSADYVGNQRFVFNIRGNNYRLVVVIKFTLGWVYVRFVGTHEEYDKIDCKTI